MKKTILIIFPEGPLVKEFSEMLSNEFELVSAGNEEDGFRLLSGQKKKIAAVLLDLKLARKSGFALNKKMEADKAYAAIPVIAIADHLPQPEDMDCLKEGCWDLLTPPSQWQLVARRIHNAIRAKDSFTYSELEKMLRELPSSIYLKDKEGRYIFSTKYMHHLETGGDPDWTIRGKTDVEVRKDKENAIKAMESDKVLLATGKGTNYIIEENDDGIREFLELIKRPVYDDEGNINGIIALVNNVTEAQLLKLELEKRSRTDALTGLLNKGATEELIRMMLSNYFKGEEKCALMMIDVDKFKTVNDTFGHVTGDRVLSAVGRVFHNSFKGKDVAGRIGGDEFMVFLRDVGNADIALSLARYVERQVKMAFDGDVLKDYVSLSIGISIFPDHGKKLEDLYQAADKALYYVKEHGRADCHLYSEELETID